MRGTLNFPREDETHRQSFSRAFGRACRARRAVDGRRTRRGPLGWIADDCLRRDFSADDLSRELPAAGVDRTVVCEARQCVEEADALLKTAAESALIAGVVGWLPIASDNFGEILEEYLAAKRRMKGQQLYQ